MGTNCLGPYLLNHFLEPILLETAASAQANSVRILWVASLVAVGTTQDGIRFDEKSGNPQALSNPMEHYMQSKVGNIFLASETGKRLKDTGIINLVSNFPII
jgi:retinol dehydrogenase-12